MRKLQSLAAAILFAFILTGCQNKPDAYERTEELFGTFVSAKVYADNSITADKALDAAFSRAAALESILSPSITESELNAVNASAFTKDTEISEDFRLLLKDALTCTQLSGGSFDCTIGELIDLWGIGTDHARIPKESEIRDVLHPIGSDLVSFVSDESIRFKDERVQLQFGAIAKGYIADEMKEVLQMHGIENGMLVLGGNVLTIGSKPEADAWTIGITDPFQPEQITASVKVSDMSVVTSGNYERYFEENGIRYHHILDPKTGSPANSGLVSATIIAESSTECDALSTAVYVLGAEKGMALLERMDGVEGILITDNGEFLLTSGMDAYEFERVKE
ncbi:MAG: FAD:protein FMN transferase [Ruminococcus sp.]|nr:FAD:protein FMN transferase [Ruminococcus sp.]